MKNKLLSFVVLAIVGACISSCSKDDDGPTPTLDKTNVTLNVGEKAWLSYSGGNCEWSTDNKYIASVKNGEVTAEHVGATIIHANELTCTVTVLPKNTTYYEPCYDWAARINDVKKYMSGYTIKGDTNTELVYAGKGKIIGYVYMFENGILKSSGFQVSLSNVVDLVDFLLERYVVIDADSNSNTYYLMSVDQKTIVVLNVSKSGGSVVYFNANNQSVIKI